jgi:hypothetical protein
MAFLKLNFKLDPESGDVADGLPPPLVVLRFHLLPTVVAKEIRGPYPPKPLRFLARTNTCRTFFEEMFFKVHLDAFFKARQEADPIFTSV